MRCPELDELPEPPAVRQGWPWTSVGAWSTPRDHVRVDDWPSVSVVVPSFNQAEYLEETIRSVLLQGYPRLELIVIDGGSTDGSVDIIRRYAPWISYWVSEPDRGQSHAINKGFERCTGEYIAWMNSDDCYLPGALFHAFVQPEAARADFLYGRSGYCGATYEESDLIDPRDDHEFSLRSLLRYFLGTSYIIPSQSVFVKRQLALQVGYLDEDLAHCMDLEWYARIALARPSVSRTREATFFYRVHPNAKTSLGIVAGPREATEIARHYGRYLDRWERMRLYRLVDYYEEYHRYLGGEKELSLYNVVRSLLAYPFEALADKRMLSLMKQRNSASV